MRSPADREVNGIAEGTFAPIPLMMASDFCAYFLHRRTSSCIDCRMIPSHGSSPSKFESSCDSYYVVVPPSDRLGLTFIQLVF